MLKGYQSWVFKNGPVILASAAIGGPFESKGALAEDFDILHGDIWLKQDSFEKAEKKMLEEACEIAIKKAGLKKEDINIFLSGDLLNQITASSFAARTLAVPYIGLYGACSCSMESLSLGALLIESRAADYVLAATSSHNASAEKQFRYPTEYGAQKPPTAQWTVTGAGAAVLGREGSGPRVSCATIGQVIDMGISDPFNMGAAMAPAAVDTIEAHFRDTGREPAYYDVIATGDLGSIGFEIARDLLAKHGLGIPENIFTDCGTMIYKEGQPIFAGASGCGCSATVTYGHFMRRLKEGQLKRVLIVATGALMSPMSYQQKESIPCVAHAVSIEM